MGIQDFFKFIDQSGNERLDRLVELSGKTLGVDISIWLHLMLQEASIVEKFHILPPISLENEVHLWLERALEYLRCFDIKLVFVFDGMRNPNKEFTDSKRRKILEENYQEFRTIWRSVTKVDDADKLSKLMKSSVYVREDIVGHARSFARNNDIPCVGAPFEADPQLVQLENQGLIDGVISQDSDIVVLGSKCLVTNMFPFDKNSVKNGGPCRIVYSEHNRVLNSLSRDQLLAATTILGTDYIGRPVGIGYKTVETYCKQWQKKDKSIPETLQSIQTTRHYSKERNEEKCENYVNDFNKNVNNFLYSPVFVISPTEKNRNVLFLKDESQQYNVFLRPLNDPSPAQMKCDDTGGSIDDDIFAALISYKPREILLEKIMGTSTSKEEAELFAESNTELSFPRFFKFHYWSRMGLQQPGDSNNAFVKDMDGAPCLKIKQPVDDEGIPLMRLADLDMRTHIWPNYSLSILIDWLETRGVRIPPFRTTKHKFVMDHVRACLQKNVPACRASQIAIGTPAHQYISWDMLYIDVGSLIWSKDLKDISDVIRNVVPIVTNAFIDDVFGVGMEGVRERAFTAMTSGQYDFATLQCAHSAKLKKSNTEIVDVVILKILVSPSIKTDAYFVHMVFRKDPARRELLLDAVSRCGCPAGRLFCSHMLGFMLIMQVVQTKQTIAMSDIIRYFPEPVQTLNAIVMYCTYFFNPTTTRTRRRKKKTRKRSSAVTEEKES